MGQYYYVCNVDKRQYLHPHKFGDGLKLMEFGSNGNGTMRALAVLLSDGNGRGSGDLRSNDPVVGSWAGDRIVIAGDYAEKGKFTVHADRNLHEVAREDYEDISDKVRAVIAAAGE